MRIIKADIVGFGKFQNQQILFDPEFQFIFGKNEGGKSTLFQFIQAILFGFPKKGKNQKDYEPKNGGSFGGHLFLETNYGKVKVSRFKDDKEAKVYLFDDQKQGGEDLLKEVLGSLTKEAFLNVYSFQTSQLDEKSNITEEELQQQLLFFGLTGSDDLLKLDKEYEAKEQVIFKKNGRQPLLNKKLTAYESLKTQIEKQEEQEQKYQELLDKINSNNDEKIQLKDRLETIESEITQTRKQKIYQPLVEEWDGLKDLPEVKYSKEDLEKLQEVSDEYHGLLQELHHFQVDSKSRSGLKEASEEDYLWYIDHLQEMEVGKGLFANQDENDKKALLLKEQIKGKSEQQKFLESTYHFSPTEPPQLLSSEKLDEVRQSLAHLAAEKEKEQELKSRPTKKLTVASLIILFIGLLGIAGSFFLDEKFKVGVLIAGVVFVIGGAILYFKKSISKSEDSLEDVTMRISSWEEEIQGMQERFRIGDLNLEALLKPRNPAEVYATNQQEQSKLETQLGIVEEQLVKQKEKIQQLFPFLPTEKGEQKDAFFTYLEEMEKIQFAIEKNDVKKVEENVLQKQQEITDLEESVMPLLTRFTLQNLSDISPKLEYFKDLYLKNQRKEEIYPKIEDFLKANVVVFKDEDELLKEKQDTQSRLMAVTEEEQGNKAQAELLIENGTLEVLLQEEANSKAEMEDLAKDYFSFKLVRKFITDLSRELSEQSLPNLLQEVSHFFGYLTFERYEKVFFNEDTIQVQDSLGGIWDLKDLSVGTKDQLLFAFRFAFITLQGNKNKSPIIIDDGWLRYDNDRKKQFLSLLSQEEAVQIILLSSDEIMKEWMKQQRHAIFYLDEGNN